MAISGKNQADTPRKPALRILLANPRGFCAGVERAIEIVERALQTYATPVYVRHEIVHNKRVVETLRAKGARFVEEVDEIPEGAVTVFSAHGVSQRVIRDAEGRRLDVIDATCPLVCKVHKEGQRYAAMGYEVVLVGHRGHPEVEGTMGQISGKVHLITCVEEVERLAPADPGKLAYVTQTTLSVDDTRDIIEALIRRFPKIKGPDLKDICYATQNRQTAVRELAAEADVILVVGSQNSSNSNRLGEIGASMDVPTYLVEEAGVLRPEWFRAGVTVGITAGASAPEELVREIIDWLDEKFEVRIETLPGAEEHVQFPLPEELVGGGGTPAARAPAPSR